MRSTHWKALWHTSHAVGHLFLRAAPWKSGAIDAVAQCHADLGHSIPAVSIWLYWVVLSTGFHSRPGKQGYFERVLHASGYNMSSAQLQVLTSPPDCWILFHRKNIISSFTQVLALGCESRLVVSDHLGIFIYLYIYMYTIGIYVYIYTIVVLVLVQTRLMITVSYVIYTYMCAYASVNMYVLIWLYPFSRLDM